MKNEHIAKGFDRLASVYGGLSRIVFAKSIERAQQYFLTSVNANDRILILGGGSGNFLQSLLKQHPGIKVDYIDISPKMIQLARKKTHSPSNVNFIIGTEQHIPDRTYTIVFTNFYLDLFEDSTLEHIVEKVKRHLSPDAHWLVTDFVSKKFWHKIMLWIMYRFFRITTGIEAYRLPEWEIVMKKADMHELDSKKFYHGFIKSSVYKFVTPRQR